MRLRIEYLTESPRTPVSRFVHRGVDADHFRATLFDPPFPAPVPGRGYPLWTLEHRGCELFFASPEEMLHVADALGRKILPDPRRLGAEQSAVNSHWLSRMDKAWMSWKVREAAVRRLKAAVAAGL